MSIALQSGSTSPLGTSIYTFVGISVPALYMPKLVNKTTRNKSGTNIESLVECKYPLVVNVDGINTVRNTIQMKTTFTALQAVLAPTEAERVFDEHVAFLVAHKAKILAGDATA